MKNIKEIARLLAETSNENLIEDFLTGILTKTEIENIDSRWELMKMLDKGVSQRQIASELHLSLCKITRGSKELQKEESALKKLIQKSNT